MHAELKVDRIGFIDIFDIEEFRKLIEDFHNNHNWDFYTILYFENNNEKENSVKAEHIIFVPKGKIMQFRLPLFITGKAILFNEHVLYKSGNEVLLFDQCSLYSNNYFRKKDRKFAELKRSFMMIISKMQKNKNIQEKIVQNYMIDILAIKKVK